MKQRPIIFVHIPKTAGTSVLKTMKTAFTNHAEGCVEVGVYNMSNKWVANHSFGAHDLPDDWNFIYGHVSIQQLLSNKSLDKDDERIVCISFLRDPVDRLISLYNYIATTVRHPLHEECISTAPQLFLKNQMEMRFRNAQYNFLACDPDVKWKFIVGVSNRIGDVLSEAFELATGVSLDKGSFDQRFNVTKPFTKIGQAHRINRSTFTDSEISRLYALNDLDTRIFEFLANKGTLHTNPVWQL